MQTLIRKAISKTIQQRSGPNGNIINLSKHSFTKEQYNLLNKNLKIYFIHLDTIIKHIKKGLKFQQEDHVKSILVL